MDKNIEGQLAIVFKIVNGKIQSQSKWEKCTISEISMAIAHLEMIKKSLIESLEVLSNKQKQRRLIKA